MRQNNERLHTSNHRHNRTFRCVPVYGGVMEKVNRIACPYCGIAFNVNIDFAFYPQSRVIRCEIEDGGCDRDFVLDYWAEPKTKVRQIKDE